MQYIPSSDVITFDPHQWSNYSTPSTIDIITISSSQMAQQSLDSITLSEVQSSNTINSFHRENVFIS